MRPALIKLVTSADRLNRYPALHLWIYAALDRLFPLPAHLLMPKTRSEDHLISPRSPDAAAIRPLQYVFAGVYLASLALVMWIYKQVMDSWVRVRAGLDKKQDSKEQLRGANGDGVVDVSEAFVSPAPNRLRSSC